jgi:hypothetical protein
VGVCCVGVCCVGVCSEGVLSYTPEVVIHLINKPCLYTVSRMRTRTRDSEDNIYALKQERSA